MTVSEAIAAAVAAAEADTPAPRRVEVVDAPGAPLVRDVPSAVFQGADDFAAAFEESVKGRPYGNRELVQVYLKRTRVAVPAADGRSAALEPRLVAEFAVRK